MNTHTSDEGMAFNAICNAPTVSLQLDTEELENVYMRLRGQLFVEPPPARFRMRNFKSCLRAMEKMRKLIAPPLTDREASILQKMLGGVKMSIRIGVAEPLGCCLPDGTELGWKEAQSLNVFCRTKEVVEEHQGRVVGAHFVLTEYGEADLAEYQSRK